MLKTMTINISCIADIDEHLFIEQGLREGISVITHRKGEVNNEYMPTFDEDKEIKFISHLEWNNLYG